MAKTKKKKSELIAEDAVIILPEWETTTTKETSVDSETIIPVRAKQAFQDGAMKAEFIRLGYKPYWHEGEIRNIPESLFNKLQQRSGNKFEKFIPRP